MALTVCLAANALGYERGGGHLWAYLNWALGLRGLGCEVLWLEAAPAKDGRTTELRVTAQGRRLLRQVHPAWSRAQQRAGEMLGDQGVRGITRTVALLSQARREGA